MRRIYLTLVAAIALVALAAVAGNVFAAHNGNSKVKLVGTGDPDAYGTAQANYSEGRGLFNAGAVVFNLNPGAGYEYRLRRTNGTEVSICSDMANSQGQFSCSDQLFDFPDPGFTSAKIYNSSNVEVASGAPFDRRGNCRDPDQAGSQCTAPGQT